MAHGGEIKVEESEEAWKQALATFKEQAYRMQNVSQEAYEVYSTTLLDDFGDMEMLGQF